MHVSQGSALTRFLLIGLLTTLLPALAQGVQLVFDLQPHGQECFFESFEVGEVFDFDFQVIYGGSLEVDVVVTGPDDAHLFQSSGRYDYLHHKTTKAGDYQLCFSNLKSASETKSVFFEWHRGSFEDDIVKTQEVPKPSTRLESLLSDLHVNIDKIHDYQSHRQMIEASDFAIAEDLASRVSLWSVFQALFMVTVGMAQVFFIRRLFGTESRVRL